MAHPPAKASSGTQAVAPQRHWIRALADSQRILDEHPGQRGAIRKEVAALSRLGAAHLALQKAEGHRAAFSAGQLRELRADATMADIRNARLERKRLDGRYLYAQRNWPLRQVLRELDANLKAFPSGTPAHERTLRDRVYVLRELGHMHEALAQARQLKGGVQAQPMYVQRAIADALLETHHPDRAARIYQRIIDKNPKVEVAVYEAWYYALVDGEHDRRAARLLARINRTTPVWILHGKEARTPNYERMDVDQLNVLDAAYRNHQALAQQRALALYRRAPRSADLINGYATVLRWRGWPHAAEHWVDLAAAYEPKARDTLINRADDARDLQLYDRWHAIIVPLSRDFPGDSTIAKSLAEYDDRQHASMSAQYVNGHSGSNAPITGRRDQSLHMRVNTPWSAGGWRAYAAEDYNWGAYDSGNASINRSGVGGEWRWGRKHAWAELSQDRLTGRQIGLELGWSQWIGDHWHYRLDAHSHAPQEPLRAARAGLRARSASVEVNWFGSESSSASLTTRFMNISDGNRRLDLEADWSQRVQASAHHLTRVTLQASAERNRAIANTAYFNPRQAHAVGVSVEHDWITWRRYERSFTQRFVVTGSSEWQQAYGSAAGVDVQYLHDWKLSRTWKLEYGVGWGSHVYDGNREHRVFAQLGVSGVF